MHTEDLRWFLTLAETEQVTAAAEMLQMSQPTLSRKLARLERQLGIDLFDRHGRRLALNQYGRILHDHASRALTELSLAEQQIAALRSPDGGTVRLDFLHSFGTWLVPELLRDYRNARPRVQFALHQDAAQTLVERVADGRSDLAVVSPRPRSPQVHWTLIAHQTLALAVPAQHRLAQRDSIELGEAADEPFIGMHQTFGMRRIFDELCAEAGIAPNIVFESSELATVGGLVSASLGVAVMPVQNPPLWPDGVTLVPIRGAGRDIGLIWENGRNLAPPAAHFRAFVAARDARRSPAVPIV